MGTSQHVNDLIVGQIGYIYSIAYRVCGDQHDAEDITQDTVMTALEKQSDLREIAALRSWMRRICVNVALRGFRRNNTIRIEPSDMMDEAFPDTRLTPEDEVLIDESLREIQNACFGFMATSLSVYQRTVFVLVEIFGVTIDETAAILRLSIGACKSHLHRARRNLNGFFSQHCQHLNPGTQCRCSCEAWKQLLSNREVTKHELQKALINPDFDEPEAMQKGSPESLKKILYLFHRLPLLQPDTQWYQGIIKNVSCYLRK